MIVKIDNTLSNNYLDKSSHDGVLWADTNVVDSKGCVGGEGETHITIGNLTIENIHIQWVRNNLIRSEFGLRGSIKNQFPLFTSFAVLPLFCRLLLFWQTEANAAGNCGAVGEWGSNRWGMYIKRNR